MGCMIGHVPDCQVRGSDEAYCQSTTVILSSAIVILALLIGVSHLPGIALDIVGIAVQSYTTSHQPECTPSTLLALTS